MAETVFTLFLVLGVLSLTLWLFSCALRGIAKFICNGIGGLCMLLLLNLFGVGIPINLFTVILTLLSGGFGVAVMLLLYLFF